MKTQLKTKRIVQTLLRYLVAPVITYPCGLIILLLPSDGTDWWINLAMAYLLLFPGAVIIWWITSFTRWSAKLATPATTIGLRDGASAIDTRKLSVGREGVQINDHQIRWREIDDLWTMQHTEVIPLKLRDIFNTDRKTHEVTNDLFIEFRNGTSLIEPRLSGRHDATLTTIERVWNRYKATTQYKALEAAKIRYVDDINLLPEERVRQYVVRILRHELRYPIDDTEIEYPIQMGSDTKRADIVIFYPGEPHLQDNIFIIVECKRSDKSEPRSAVEQLKSYLSACPNVRYGILTSNRWYALEKRLAGNRFQYTEIQLPDVDGNPCIVKYKAHE